MFDVNNRLYYPMIVSNLGTSESLSHEEDSLLWKKFLLMSELNQDMLTDQQMPLQIIRLQEQFNLKDQSIGSISLFIRKIFFGELTLEGCEAKIGSMLLTTGGGDPNQARAIVEFIQKEILTITPKPRAEEKEDSEEKSVQRTTVNLPLLQALSKYGNLGNQLITQERIKVKSQQEPVRPSLLYWLKCYRDELGIGQHNSVERGDFLFRSENCKKLSPEERERVNLILKSIEENLPLSIDTEHQEIIFPLFQGVVAGEHREAKTTPSVSVSNVNNFQNPAFFNPIQSDAPAHNDRRGDLNGPTRSSHANNALDGPARSSYANSVAGGGAVSFSAGHIFPAEKEVIEKREEAPIQRHGVSDDSNPFIIHPSSKGRQEA